MFGYNELDGTEQNVKLVTSTKLKGFYDNFPKFVDLGFSLQESFGEFESIDTPFGELQSIAYMHFVQLPYTLKVIYEQIIRGYYLESQILVRHLFEALLELKYFYKHPEKIKCHYSKRIRIVDMVDGITKKPLYKTYKHLCSYAHGFIMKDIHRTDRELNKTYIGNIYKEQHCTVPINYLSEIILGFINIYDCIFTKNTIDKDEIRKERKKYAHDWCVLSRDSHMKFNISSKEWHETMHDLVF